MASEREYWFPAKRYGWGWGFPRRWEGWVAIAIFLGLLVVGNIVVRSVTVLIAYDVVIAGLLVLVCWLKGEPPRWRWG